MKTYKKYSKSFLVFICTVGLLTLLLSACSKPPTNYNYAPPVAALAFIQASPDEPPVDFFLADSKVNQAPINYGQSFNYFSIMAGSDSIAFYNDATMKTILTDAINFTKNTTYSMFLANKSTKPEIVLLTDTLAQPTAGNAAIRFINLSPDAPAVDLVVKGGAVLVSNRSYKGYSSFAPVQGNMFYTLEVHQAGTAIVLATLANLKLNTGFLYTVWFHGLAAGTATTDQLSVDIFNNAFFL